MQRKKLLEALDRVEQLALGSKWTRFSHQPSKYLKAQWFRQFIYPKTKQGRFAQCETFFEQTMQVVLPAAMDLYLTGGKTHRSELKLTRFFIRHLENEDFVLDIGAHFGFYTLLAAEIVGPKGLVWSFEPSKATFEILQNNTKNQPQILAQPHAVSSRDETLVFYEFPVLYSEYNTLKPEQFAEAQWLTNFQPKVFEVQALALGPKLQAEKRLPKLIKMDVEGAEDQAVEGLLGFLHEVQDDKTALILEFLSQERGSEAHEQALSRLGQAGFRPYTLDNQGYPHRLQTSPQIWLDSQNLDSDNLVFFKDE